MMIGKLPNTASQKLLVCIAIKILNTMPKNKRAFTIISMIGVAIFFRYDEKKYAKRQSMIITPAVSWCSGEKTALS